ncbi:MAG TPA: response regulator [Methylomirabilota bacterium]|jgi:DNA-binding NtrC family response regulator|nr:response regulator [Methylomirabilota bacterium]
MKPLVLIVDDEPEIRDILAELLAGSYRTTTAANGADALTLFLREHPDVVLLDINMPGTSGIDVQKDMRAIDDAVPVIMLTAVQDVDRIATALRNGAFSYLPKPCDARYLRHLLAAALSQRRR